MSSIELIRAEVEKMRRAHAKHHPDESWCDPCTSPDLLVKLSEDKLRLAETLEWAKSYLDQPQQAHVDNVLMEIAK